MSLITTIDLGKSFGADDIFSHISLSMQRQARIGLVGPNGIGKTTLLRILAGEEEPTSGVVQRTRNLRIGYLPQEAYIDSQHTLWEESLSAFGDILILQERLSKLESAMSDPQREQESMLLYGKLQEKFEHIGGYTYETRIRQTLSGLGFSEKDWSKPFEQLSGGQRTRALLARLLLSDPDVLLLDEPTNHLDIAAIEWLEAYLRDWKGAVVIVSHDRYFLNMVVNTIWEMNPVFEVYRGNYSEYLRQRAEHYERRLKEYKSQQVFIERETEYIKRNIAGQNTRQAQGRRKRLERWLKEARRLPVTESRRLHMKLQTVSRSGDLVLCTGQLSVGYTDEGQALISIPDLELLRGECAAILGPNGAGKTTFLKTLLGNIPPLMGEVIMGASLKVGYLAQAHEGLHPEWSLMEEIEAVAPNLLPAEIRSYLAQFLFRGDDVYKTIEMLSGGECSRLALACLALQGANLLLLDEPTNHLDLPSQDVLQSILADYDGTILLVSHDRYLIDDLATQIWEVVTDDKELRVFKGSYSEYRAERLAEAARESEKRSAARMKRQKKRIRSRATTQSTNMERFKVRRLGALEAEVAELEGRLEVIGRWFENPPSDAVEVQRLGQEYSRLQQELNERLEEWGKLAD